MKTMILLKNKNYKVFFNRGDLEKAKKFRKENPKLKYARITKILQAYPSSIELGKIYF